MNVVESRAERADLDARDALHDELGNTLGRLARRLDGLLVDGGPGLSVTELRRLRLLATDALHALRSVVDADSARRLAGEGVDDALARMADNFSGVGGTCVDLRVQGDLDRVESRVADVVLDVAWETFSNISRNARPTFVLVSLDVKPDAVDLVIVDDGVDLAQRQVVAWRSAVELGLQRMARAARSVDGRLGVCAVRPRGIRIRASLPLLPRSRG